MVSEALFCLLPLLPWRCRVPRLACALAPFLSLWPRFRMLIGRRQAPPGRLPLAVPVPPLCRSPRSSSPVGMLGLITWSR
eukprot:5654044-Pyramimonas_sp.AAC.1